jgi:hypothetical protein
MVWKKLNYIALAVLVSACLAGLGIRQWASASDGPETCGKHFVEAAAGKDGPKPGECRPSAPVRRREAVIRLPVGTLVRGGRSTIRLWPLDLDLR